MDSKALCCLCSAKCPSCSRIIGRRRNFNVIIKSRFLTRLNEVLAHVSPAECVFMKAATKPRPAITPSPSVDRRQLGQCHAATEVSLTDFNLSERVSLKMFL